ncbi:endospore germination permease [Paenibacillus sp. LHD-117]|uniref:GerAB/ArcD/ProY family transporter n=1 Tax=Paenibacillus sp. LHD-117 TaxID=3071412 RepID=UPI0027DFEDB9|nr:endospore germination permease [Paenibacillus sp. LHD-117]MDQ6420225.1 endospore germination permease [Paenibacillus sp. LHD-117]
MVQKHQKITNRQFAIIVALYIIGIAILIIPSYLTVAAKQDAWIAAILTVGAALAIIPLYNALGRRFPDKTFAEYTEEILGRWIGKAVSFLFFIGFPFLIAALTLRGIGDFMTTQVIPETPIQAVHILFMAVVVMGARLGLEPLVRAAEIFFPWIMLLFALLVVFISPQIKLDNLLPIMEGGIKPIVMASIPFFSFPFLDLAMLLMIYPYVNQTEKAGKAMFIGVLIGGIILCVITALSILVLGADQTARNTFPSYVITKNISIGDFLERIEAIMAIIWFITSYFRLALLFYITALGLTQCLNLRDYKVITLPLAMIVLVFSITAAPHSIYLMNFIPVGGVYAPTYGLLLPILLLSVAVVRKKGSHNG